MSNNSDNTPGNTNFKFKSLRVYGNFEWMYDSTKKYRTVYDRLEIDYIGAELKFFNKLFDEKEWEANLVMKCIDESNSTEKCKLEKKLTVKIDEDIVTVLESWGNETKGSYWKKGIYRWEAYIDNQLLGSQKFYVEDVGLVTPKNNPYFDVESVKLYSSSYEGWKDKDRKYLTQFNREKTQYVWAEFNIKIKTNAEFRMEYFTNYKDDCGQLKGHVESQFDVKKNSKGKAYSWEAGWGNRSGGSFMDTDYSVEILFMDTLVAFVPFRVGDKDVEGLVELSKTPQASVINSTKAAEPEETMEQVMQKLNELVGLDSIKKKVNEHIKYIEFLKLRKEQGFEESEEIKLHSVFTGNPGTGKTTVVKLLGKIYKHIGLLTNGEVHEVDRVDLVGQYIGQTAPKVQKAIDTARGGILFVDEAYSLMRGKDDSQDYGREVLEILIKEMSDGEGDIAIMFAGYPKEMETFMNGNPGLRSRVSYYYHFDDYTPDELYQIALFGCKKKSVILTDEAAKMVEKILMDAYRERDNTFGNARYAHSLIDEGKMNMGLRLVASEDTKSLTKEKLSTIEAEDIEKIVAKSRSVLIDIPVDEALLKDALSDLNKLVGLTNIKTEVSEMVKLVRYYRDINKEVLNSFSLHSVFTGNPGTGKTTIARLMGKIYKALGLIERGHVVEVDREGLIAGFIGQTAIKTKEAIDRAMGGILFIDEAYALSEESGHSNYGNEAIEVILKNMEDKRGKFGVIVAGYPDNMSQFLKANPGLKSRFDKTFHFVDYNVEELFRIALLMLNKEGLMFDEQAAKSFTAILEKMYAKRDKFFGNAREVRKLVTETVRKQNLRMASMSSDQRTLEMLSKVSIDDLVEPVIVQSSANRKVGFM